jgi:transcriptional regulator with XRE-family HTH domain
MPKAKAVASKRSRGRKPSVGKLIRDLRMQVGISGLALATSASVDPAVLTRLETQARSGVQFATVCRLAEALGVSVEELAVASGLKSGPAKRIKPSSLVAFEVATKQLSKTLIRGAATLDDLNAKAGKRRS